MALQFTEDDLLQARETWSCNCGPAALAAITRVDLDTARKAVESIGFAKKRYMNPTMMEEALAYLGLDIVKNRRQPTTRPAQFPCRGLVRIQFTGPWMDPNDWRVAYRHTHWIASRRVRAGDPGQFTRIFDVNCGSVTFDEWLSDTLPLLVGNAPNRTGWQTSHRWEVGTK